MPHIYTGPSGAPLCKEWWMSGGLSSTIMGHFQQLRPMSAEPEQLYGRQPVLLCWQLQMHVCSQECHVVVRATRLRYRRAECEQRI